MTTLDDVFREKQQVDFFVLIVIAVAIALGVVKVKNELAMTRAYDRQAAALERIAYVLEAEKSYVTAQLAHDPMKLSEVCK